MAIGTLIKAGLAVGTAMGATEKISSAITGAADKIAQSAEVSEGGFGIVIGGPSGLSLNAGASQKAPASATIKCAGCHAPLTGLEGSEATCPYCDTTQTIG